MAREPPRTWTNSIERMDATESRVASRWRALHIGCPYECAPALVSPASARAARAASPARRVLRGGVQPDVPRRHGADPIVVRVGDVHDGTARRIGGRDA